MTVIIIIVGMICLGYFVRGRDERREQEIERLADKIDELQEAGRPDRKMSADEEVDEWFNRKKREN